MPKKWSLFSDRFVFHGWLIFLDERYQSYSMSSLLTDARESTWERDAVNIPKWEKKLLDVTQSSEERILHSPVTNYEHIWNEASSGI